MSVEIISTNPVVKAIISGTAPAPALFAAARGILPLPQTDLLEVLVHLAKGTDAELASTAQATLNNQETNSLTAILESAETASVESPCNCGRGTDSQCPGGNRRPGGMAFAASITATTCP